MSALYNIGTSHFREAAVLLGVYIAMRKMILSREAVLL